MGRQLLRVGGVVAGHVGDDSQLALGFRHDVFQHHLALFLALVDALAGAAADVQAFDALLNEPAGQGADRLGIDLAFRVIAGVESRDDAFVLFDVSHLNYPLCREMSGEEDINP